MNRLANRLAGHIRKNGPVNIAEYMAIALTDPDDGYYTNCDPLGAAGDFTTAPEISQMFGEMLGAWCIDCWHSMGRPEPFALAELGPGRGTLMADMLRVAALDPAFLTAAQIHLVEASPTLQSAQRKTLWDFPVTWHRHCDELPALPLLLVANEFFDALPIRQFEMTSEGWCERMVDIQTTDTATGSPKFRFVSSEPLDPGPLPAFADASRGTIAETSPQTQAIAAQLAEHVVAHGGACLIVDYGYVEGSGDTLQAVRAHQFADVLDDPGNADLTAHVDFSTVARVATAAKALVHGATEQGGFLRLLGIEERAAALKSPAGTGQKQTIDSALRRLIADGEMGTLFKVMALTSPNLRRPAGFSG